MIKQTHFIKSLGFLFCLLLINTVHADGKSLYDRLGGDKGARAISADIWNNHSKNPIVNNRFVNSDPAYVKQKVFELISASTGGSIKYTGKDMLTTHAGMNISDMEFNAVVDDVMNALEQNHVGKQEQNEMLAILWSVKDQVVNGKMTTKSLSPN